MLFKCCARRWVCVVFPHRSTPSNRMNAPLPAFLGIAFEFCTMVATIRQWQW
jgi:hypothetical protein